MVSSPERGCLVNAYDRFEAPPPGRDDRQQLHAARDLPSDAVVRHSTSTSGRIVWSASCMPNDVFNSACSMTPKGPRCPEGAGLITTSGRRRSSRRPVAATWLLAGKKSGSSTRSTRKGTGKSSGRRASRGRHERRRPVGDGELTASTCSPRRPTLVTPPPPARRLDPRQAADSPRCGSRTAQRVADHPRRGPRQLQSGAIAALTAIPGVVFTGSHDGHLRAYSTRERSR